MNHYPTIAFIGGGNMTRNIVMGLIADHYPVEKIWVSNRSIEKLIFFREQAHVNVSPDNRIAAEQADILILAIKPQQVKSVCEEIKDIVAKKKPLIISVAVGITTVMIEKWLGNKPAIVRVMPNTPTSVRAGASGIYANPVTDEI